MTAYSKVPDIFLRSPNKGLGLVIVRDQPVVQLQGTVAMSGYQHVFRLQAGDSVAVTMRDSDGSASTRFFYLMEDGRFSEAVAPHGAYRDDPPNEL